MRGEVVADFRETYGIDLPIGGGLDGATDEDLCRWQVLYSQLPARSRVFVRLEPDNLWDDGTRLLSMIEHELRCFHYGFTEDAKKRINAPQRIMSPGERARNARRRDSALAAKSEIASAFGMES
jgi:hypothetical protein|nr:MAG TPA: protein of unknown function (DUF5361) [Bacteriophage sp.]